MSSLGNKEVMSKNLKFYIERSGKTRKELADIWGFPYSTVTEWVNGNKYPRIDRIEIMADYFGIMKSDLIEDWPRDLDLPEEYVKLQGTLRDLRTKMDEQLRPVKGVTEKLAAIGSQYNQPGKNLSKSHVQLINMVEGLSEEKAEWLLGVMKSILKDEI